MSVDIEVDLSLLESLDFEIPCRYDDEPECAGAARWMRRLQHTEDDVECIVDYVCEPHRQMMIEHWHDVVQRRRDIACQPHQARIELVFTPITGGTT